jgi:DNA repair exonuclease SbcCD ATPase subunit
MYATQWFLTFFAYKFPLEFVLRIFDIVITEGFESILKFAIALVSKNEAKLLTLKFDALLEFLKENLFSAYLIEPEEAEEEGEDQHQTLKSNLGGFFKFDQPKPITVDTYNVNQFIEDATNVKLLPITLRRYAEEFEQIHQHEKERQEEVDELKLKNQQLRKEIRKVETSYTILNREHVQIANEIINNRIKVGTLEDEIKDLKSQNHSLRDRIISIQKQEVEVPADFENDLKNAMERNLAVMTQNQELEDQVSSLVQELEQLRTELENSKSVEPQTSQPAEQTHSKGWGKKFFK